MPLNKNFSEEQKEVYMQALLFMKNIEKATAAVKKEFIDLRALEAHFPQKKLSSLKPLKKTEEVAALLKKSNDVCFKRFVLREMIILSLVDHEITDKEIKAIYKTGSQAGISEEKIDDFFLWAAKGLEWQLEGLKLVEEDL